MNKQITYTYFLLFSFFYNSNFSMDNNKLEGVLCTPLAYDQDGAGSLMVIQITQQIKKPDGSCWCQYIDPVNNMPSELIQIFSTKKDWFNRDITKKSVIIDDPEYLQEIKDAIKRNNPS